MPAIKVTQEYFSSSAKLYGADGLGAVIRGLAIDHARIKVMAADIEDLTDNSGGSDAGATGLVDLDVPTAAFDATSANGADDAEFNTAIGKIENAMAVIAEAANTARAKLGLTAFTYAGTVAASNTIAALDTSVSAATGANAIDYTEGKAAMETAKKHLRKLVFGLDEVFVALGETKLTSAVTGDYTSAWALTAIADAASSADGSEAVSKADADDFLADFADNIATIAAKWNAVMVQASDTEALSVVAG